MKMMTMTMTMMMTYPVKTAQALILMDKYVIKIWCNVQNVHICSTHDIGTSYDVLKLYYFAFSITNDIYSHTLIIER